MAAVLDPIAADQPYYARRNDAGFYTWEGVKLPSVTTIIGSAPGQYLMLWYAKRAAQDAAVQLMLAGIEPPSHDEQLLDLLTGSTIPSLTKPEAVDAIFAWQHRMRAAERYRDHKARIGSVTHHAVYEHALGNRYGRSELEDYLRHIAISLNLWYTPKDPEFRPTEAMVCEVANSALAYVLSAFEWIEKAQPEWEMIGQEAVVVHPEDEEGVGYAGTVDFIAGFKQAVWEKHFEWPRTWCNEVKLVGDFKTSNSLAHRSVQAQIEAYRHAKFIGLVQSGETFPIPETDGIMALHIGPHASLAGVQDEFGTLESKAKVIGAKAYTWPGSEDTWRAFRGLCHWFRYTEEIPRAHEQRQRASAPRPTPGGPRPAPF
jgi:hypothetical protein